MYLCALLLAESYAPESNPGQRPPKFPCGICQKAVKWSTPGVQCDSCKLWYHQDCIGMGDHIYFALKNVSWECFKCGLPNFSSGIFDLTLFETSNRFESLSADNAKSSELEFSFDSPQAVSSPKRLKNQSLTRDQRDGLFLHSTVNNTDEQLLHPSLPNDTEGLKSIHISKDQRKDMLFKVININCQFVADKIASLLTLCESTGADIVIGTESWLTDQHLSTEISPDNYKVYRPDRKKKKGDGVFILVKSTFPSLEPEELNANDDCEMIWVQIQVIGASHLYVGAFYHPPDIENPDYLSHLDACLSRIPEGAHVWIGADFNLADINWTDNSVCPSAAKPALFSKLIDITNNRFLQQLVTEPTRIIETTESILDLFFTNNSSLISNVEVIPGISDHEAVYIEPSLRPHFNPVQLRKVYCYNKGDQSSMNEDLLKLHQELQELPSPTTDSL